MNKLKVTFLFLWSLFFIGTYAQKTYNTILTNEEGDTHLIGLSNRAGLLQAPFQEWFESNYTAYEVDKEMLAKAKGKTKKLEVKIFMGTWCGDSKRAVPVFYKLMDELNISEDQITLVNLDAASENYKQSPAGEEKGLNIHRVPTFIFYKKDEEIGRIVESPATNFETDIAQILNGIPSTPNYKGVTKLHEILQAENVDVSQENLLPLARKVYRSVKNDRELNTYGYVLKARGELEKAIAVFEINRIIFPKVANVYDSLAEAYLEQGNEESALLYYKKVLELEPEHEVALEQVEKMRVEGE